MTPSDLSAARRQRLPSFRAEEIQAAVSEAAAIFRQIENPDWPPPPDYGKAYTICMTPRAGTTFLAHAMTAAGIFGHPQEYLHRLEPTALRDHARLYRANSWPSYLAALGSRTRTNNGIFGVKADPNMLLPLLVDGTFDHTLVRGKFIYVTRGDLVMQAISHTKAQFTGSWSSDVRPRTTPEFDFGAIYNNVLHLADMRSRWESFFAYHGITPLRVTYEQIDLDIDAVLSHISAFLGLPSPQRQPRVSNKHQRDDTSTAWRERFLSTLGLKQKSCTAA